MRARIIKKQYYIIYYTIETTTRTTTNKKILEKNHKINFFYHRFCLVYRNLGSKSEKKLKIFLWGIFENDFPRL